jgi:pimeloyl-ACP methyl ester carboxylesterase
MLSSQTVCVLKPLQLGGGIDGKYCSRSRIMAWLLVLGQDNVHAARFRPPSFLRRSSRARTRHHASRLVYSDAYLERVCSTVESLSGAVVLVGHSMGGIVISGVAERLRLIHVLIIRDIAQRVKRCDTTLYPANKHTVGELAGFGWSVSGRPCRGS